jgi:hypothetical protein
MSDEAFRQTGFFLKLTPSDVSKIASFKVVATRFLARQNHLSSSCLLALDGVLTPVTSYVEMSAVALRLARGGSHPHLASILQEGWEEV